MNVLNENHAKGRGQFRAYLTLIVFAGCLAGCCTITTRQGVSMKQGVQGTSVPFMQEDHSSTEHAINVTAFPETGAALRVGGDMDATVVGRDGDYRFASLRVDTPLPVGYPRPTPPGAIELKTYPSARIAEVTGKGNPDRGMNSAFWPLFNHIKKHDIAMTAPVEMYYAGMDQEQNSKPDSWSMAFLYRTPELNDTGTEGDVRVRDTEPVTVLSIGMKGNYSMALVERGRRMLLEYLDEHSQWQIDGDWRVLYYNGPAIFFWNKWAEVQVPVRQNEESQGTTSVSRAR